MKSYLSHLECTVCGKALDHRQAVRTCPDCGKVLFPRYDLARVRREVSREVLVGRPAILWRFYELLPVLDPASVVSLGEGGTPLLKAEALGRKLGLPSLYVKDEGLNPTGTFKARGLSVAVSKAKELGVRRLTMPSAGNAAGAMAAYAARAGLEAYVFMPRDAPEANRKECLAYGSHLTLVDGHIGDAGKLSRQRAAQEGLFDLSTLQEPYRVEGKKTMALELAQDLGWHTPDVILYPTGGGTGIIGMWKAFGELMELGWVEGPMPRFVAVQAQGCQPIVAAFHQGKDRAEPWPLPQTVAQGLKVPGPFADYLILRIVRETGGTALPVPDEEMVRAMAEMAREEGILPCPEGAATLAALKRLVAQGYFRGDERIVLLNTGSGLKYMELVSGEAPQAHGAGA